MRCPCLSSLREWFAAAWALMGWPGNPDFTLAIVFGHAPRCGDRVALMALRGVVISMIRTIRYQVTQDGNTTPPGRRETRSRAAYLMRRHIQFDYEYVMMVTKDPPNQPTRWRPKSRAHLFHEAMGEDVHSRARATDLQRADTTGGGAPRLDIQIRPG